MSKRVWVPVSVLVALLAVGVVIGCGDKKAEEDPPKPSLEGKIVNVSCPIMAGNKIDPDDVPNDLRRSHDGKVIGFCCKGCPEKWDALSDEAKATALAAAMPKAPAPTPPAPTPTPVVNGKCPMQGSKIDAAGVKPELVREFNGQKVGFCCPGCLKPWDALADDAKAAKLAAAMAEAPAPTPPAPIPPAPTPTPVVNN